MNKKLYKKLLSFRSHSGSGIQEDFRDWLEDYIVENYENVTTEVDGYGNLYVTKKTTDQRIVNCVIAHLDINQSVKTSNFSIVEAGRFIVGINNETGKQIGLGHDDKTGVYFALKALEKFPDIKCFFPLDEEVGLVGTRNCVEEFFEDNVGFMVQLDRRGFSDISQYTNGHATVTSKTKYELMSVLAKHNFHWVNTMSTDVGHLIQEFGVQGVNISCGYENEHKDDETLDVWRYNACERFAMDILKRTNGKYYRMDIAKTTTTNKSTSTSSSSSTTSSSNYNKSTSAGSTSNTSKPQTTPTAPQASKVEVVEVVDEKKNLVKT